MLNRLKQLGAHLKQEAGVYRRIAADPRTPKVPKLLLVAAIGYVMMPFDLIPDWIPVLGWLDDLVLVPLLVVIALKMIPPDVVADARKNR